MLTIVVLAIASETGLGISVWGFIVSVQGGSLMDALAAVILFVASALAMDRCGYHDMMARLWYRLHMESK